ncbi:GAF domain-containing protein [Granulicella sp. dw_53]|uniref:GAF domain-containing protein n=1 Tax=Granulicella sp. dw_53 TaxID=2719792 RepID=UPI001BD4F9FA|nr:GAF domain-containing protein [Granulicella sp. dw_53]
MTKNRHPDRAAVLTEIHAKASDASSLSVLQEQIVKILANSLPHYSWTGFYMLDPEDPETLVVGPYVGNPTPHVRIPVSQGICGAAVATGETVIVDDVGFDPRYLSCSIETKSEIVVPIHAGGKIIGEIDIDSHNLAAFAVADRDLLEAVARIVGDYVENHPSEINQN